MTPPSFAVAFSIAGAVNLVVVGVPIVATTHALLAVGTGWPPRVRHRIALIGFAMAMVLPFACAWPRSASAWTEQRVPASPAARLAELPLGLLVAGGCAWFLGALWLVARETRAWRRAARAARRWRPVPPAVAEARGLPRDVRFVAGGEAGPMAFGWRRPAVVLPAWAWRLPDPALQALAAHETAHVRGRDPQAHRVGRLALAVLWPFVHLRLAYARVRLEREIAADAEAVRRLRDDCEHPELAWAEVLLAAARRSRNGVLSVGAASELERRLRRLLDPPPHRPLVAAAGLAVTMIAFAASLLGVSAPRGPTPDGRVPRAGERWSVVDHLHGHNAVVVRPADRPPPA